MYIVAPAVAVADVPDRVAVCITGLAQHRGQRFYEHTLYDGFASWLDAVKAHGMQVDVFYVVDTRDADDKREEGNEYIPIKSRTGLPILSQATFEPMLHCIEKRAGTVIFEQANDETPLCDRRPCLCENQMTYPRWWEQVVKNERCLHLVEDNERRTGLRYQWLLKARTEYRWRGALSATELHMDRVGYDGISLNSFLHATTVCPSCTWTQHYNGDNCFAMMDWAAIMPRSNPAFMTIAAAPCAWINVSAQHFLGLGWQPRTTHGSRQRCQTNERWLGLWMEHHGVQFRMLPEPNSMINLKG
jgi:hypothetical protein